MTENVEIKGTITIDGVATAFLFVPDGGYTQWGGTTEQLGNALEYVTAMEEGLSQNSDYFSEAEAEEDDHECQDWLTFGETEGCAHCAENGEQEEGEKDA